MIIRLKLGIDHLWGTWADKFGNVVLRECAASASLSRSFGRRRRATKAVRCQGPGRVHTESGYVITLSIRLLFDRVFVIREIDHEGMRGGVTT